MNMTRQVHEKIRSRIEERLGRRSWSWLARESGIPKSTLMDQVRKPKFSLINLVRIAEVLDTEPAELLPEGTTVERLFDGRGRSSSAPAADATARLGGGR